MVGAGVGCPDPAEPKLHFQRNPVLTALSSGEHGPVVAEHLRRSTPPVERRREHLPHLGDGEDPPGTEAMQTREWLSRMLQISTSVRSASRQWVMSAGQRSFG